MDAMEAGGLAAELLAKHRNSTQPSSRTLVAVLAATLEVLQAEGIEPTPAAIFAATMSSLEKPQGHGSPEVAMALCTMLGACLGRVPDGLVRAKFAGCAAVVLRVLDAHQEEAAVLRAAVPALGQVTAAMDPGDWPSASAPFHRLLGLSLDARPKVRRAAHAAVAATLAAVQGTPAAAQAGDAIMKVCAKVLPGPEVALKAASAATGKQRAETEALVQRAVTDASHLLNLLRLALPLLPSAPATAAAELLPKLFPLQHPLLTRLASDALAALAGGGGSQLGPKPLARLLAVLLREEAAWQSRDADALLSLVQLLGTGFGRLQEQDGAAAAEGLDEAFSRLAQLLSAGQESVRQGAAHTLRGLVRACLLARGRRADSLEGPLAVLEAALGPAYQEAWPAVLSVVEELFRGLPASDAPAAAELLSRLGGLCGAAAAALAEGEAPEEAAAVSRAAGSALGAAITGMGPAAVLRALPLSLQAQDGSPPRTWLLPLLRQHVSGAELACWGATLLPLGRAAAEAAAAPAATPEQRLQALQLRAVEVQVWACLPAFCSWPTDLPVAFRKYAQDMGRAFQNREDLRPAICAALERLCSQVRAAVKAADGGAASLGFSDPAAGEDGEGEEGEEAAAAAEAQAVPPHFTAELAQQNVATLQQFAKNWLPLLFNAFVAAPAGGRGFLARAIGAYAAVAPPALLDSFFRTVAKKLIEATQDAGGEGPAVGGREGGDSPSERRCTFMELALALTPGLPPDAVRVLYTAAAPALQEKDQAVQKRAYRLLAYILEARPDFVRGNFQGILDALLLGVATSMSAAKRYRLRCLKAATTMLQAPDAPDIAAPDDEMQELSQPERRKQVVSMLVGEIVLCTKEVNKRTRVAAYELLVALARAMHAADPPRGAIGAEDPHLEDPDGAGGSGGLHTLFTMLLGGLVGATPHMVSASVMGLARLLYEFAPLLQATAPQLLPVVLSLLRSRSREVVKAVLGFVKVCAMKLPPEMLQAHLPAILEGILLWAEDSKNKFKLKVRMILERLVRRLGHDALAAAIPEQESRLLTHIRKEHQRKQRQRAGQSEAASQADEEEAAMGRSQAGRSGRTQRSRWGATDVFGSEDEGGGGGRSTRGPRSAAKSRAPTQSRLGRGAAAAAVREQEDPADLLDPATSRAMLRTAGGGAGGGEDEPDFRMEGGRMVVEEPAAPGGGGGARKRKRGLDPEAEEDSDFEDLQRVSALRISGGRGPRSTAAGSAVTRSAGGKTAAGRTSASSRSRATSRGKEHSGERFAARKGGAGGDVKGRSKVEPYAYWPLDRGMLNRRPAKKARASKGLASVVAAAKAGAAKGRKAKAKHQGRKRAG